MTLEGKDLGPIQHETESARRSNAALAGWICLLVGLVLMFWSLTLVVLYGPLFLASFILSITAMAQRRIAAGVVLLVTVVGVTPVLWLVTAAVKTASLFESGQSTASASGEGKGQLSATENIVLKPGEQWVYEQSSDPMASGKTYSATVRSTNTVEFGYPYSGAQRASLTLRTHPRYGKDVIFRIERGQLLCRSYDGCNVLVRFDDGESHAFEAGAASDNSTEVLFIRDYQRFVRGLLASERVRISPEVYQEGSPIFEFDLRGFDQSRYKPAS